MKRKLEGVPEIIAVELRDWKRVWNYTLTSLGSIQRRLDAIQESLRLLVNDGALVSTSTAMQHLKIKDRRTFRGHCAKVGLDPEAPLRRKDLAVLTESVRRARSRRIPKQTC